MLRKILRFIKMQYMQRVREMKRRIYTNRFVKGCVNVGECIKVNYKSNSNGNTYLGNNVNFNGMKILGSGKVKIGDNFHSGTECMMITHVHNYEGIAIPYDSTYIYKDITIEDNVWLANRVIVLGGVTIGEGAIIQAGSVVVKDIPKYAIAGGHPAQVFRYRDIAHYEKLKGEQKFH